MADHRLLAALRFLKKYQDDVSRSALSLNESMATRVAAAVAGQLGVSIKGVVESVELLGWKGLEGMGEATEGIGSVLRGLFGGDQQ